APNAMMTVSITTASTAATRPTTRCSAITTGVSMNASSIASAMFTSIACARYSTATTSTLPMNVIHGCTARNESAISAYGCLADQRLRSEDQPLALDGHF